MPKGISVPRMETNAFFFKRVRSESDATAFSIMYIHIQTGKHVVVLRIRIGKKWGIEFILVHELWCAQFTTHKPFRMFKS